MNGISIGQHREKASHCCFAALIVVNVSLVVFFDIIYHNGMQSDWLTGVEPGVL